ncbi:MAG: TIGR03085 family protein [Pseudonocardiaceae bacterium]|nr:TIGR03085 family protein [Pseudonocardiaceae bacterium]
MGAGRDLATGERRALSALLGEVGPAAPTLCAGWTTRDLAAHLVVRDRRPDALPGLVAPPLAWWTDRVQQGVTRRPWSELVELVRSGPPVWSPLGLPGPFDAVDAVEFFVHHEDVRRAREGWTARPHDPERDEVLWRALASAARLSYRRCPVGVVLRRDDGSEHVARRGPRAVAIVGAPGELLLHAYGREAVVVDFEGEQADVAAVRGLRRGI